MITLLAEVATTPGFYFRYGPIGVALGVLIPLAVLYAIFLYRRHSELSPKLRIGLGILRAIVYGVIILLLFAPVINETKKISIPSNILVLLDVSESMSIEDRRSRPGELADAAAAFSAGTVVQPWVRGVRGGNYASLSYYYQGPMLRAAWLDK